MGLSPRGHPAEYPVCHWPKRQLLKVHGCGQSVGDKHLKQKNIYIHTYTYTYIHMYKWMYSIHIHIYTCNTSINIEYEMCDEINISLATQ